MMRFCSKTNFTRLFLMVLFTLAVPVPSAAEEVVVSAAASLTDAFKSIGAAFSRSHNGTTIRFNFGASGALQQQILAGAPVDLFASASPVEMNSLQKAGKIDPSTRADFAFNSLVLVCPTSGAVRSWEDLRSPAVSRIAIGKPTFVPAGRYAKEMLDHLGLWKDIRAKAVLGENVRQTLSYVATGDVQAGIVFATDAESEKARVRVIRTAVPGQDHTPIVYPVAVIKPALNSRGARLFRDFLLQKEAQSILSRFGFRSVLQPSQRKSASKTGAQHGKRSPAKHP